MFQADLSQAESRATGYLSQDLNYIEACESGDLHTYVAHRLFGIPNNREAADKIFYRHFSYRDLSKPAGHGTNYLLTPMSLARNLHIDLRMAYRFHLLYLGGELEYERVVKMGLLDMRYERDHMICFFPGEFSGIRRWHQEVRQELQTHGYLTTPFKMRRRFWTRLEEDKTVRDAVAFLPQSTVADVANTGGINIHRQIPEVQLLGQGHDAILGQYPLKLREEILPKIKEVMTFPVEIHDRQMVIPVEIKIGQNWRDLKKWTN